MADGNITPEERREIDEARASAKADSTTRRYDSAMKMFSEWLIDRGESDELPISPGLVLVYLLKRSDKYKKKTLSLVVSAIKHAHESAGYPSPTDDPEVKELMQGIARRKKGEGVKQAPGHGKVSPESRRQHAFPVPGVGVRAKVWRRRAPP